MMAKRDGVLTTGDIARICKVAPRTASKWCDRGLLKHYRIPMSLDRRVPVSEVIRFMRENGMPLGELAHIASHTVLLVGVSINLADRVTDAMASVPGYQVCSAASLYEAGLLAAEKKPAVVVLDLSLGRTECQSVLSSIRRDASGGGVEMVAICPEDVSDAPGYDRVFRTPFDPQDLIAWLRSYQRKV